MYAQFKIIHCNINYFRYDLANYAEVALGDIGSFAVGLKAVYPIPTTSLSVARKYRTL